MRREEGWRESVCSPHFYLLPSPSSRGLTSSPQLSSRAGVAVSVTGVGESVVRGVTAREVAVQCGLPGDEPLDEVRGGVGKGSTWCDRHARGQKWQNAPPFLFVSAAAISPA
jgi:hypothetical protein